MTIHELTERIKGWWPVIPILGFFIAFSTHLTNLWSTPEEVKQVQKAVSELSTQLQAYTAGEEEANKQRDKLISLMAAKLMEEPQ